MKNIRINLISKILLVFVLIFFTLIFIDCGARKKNTQESKLVVQKSIVTDSASKVVSNVVQKIESEINSVDSKLDQSIEYDGTDENSSLIITTKDSIGRIVSQTEVKGKGKAKINNSKSKKTETARNQNHYQYDYFQDYFLNKKVDEVGNKESKNSDVEREKFSLFSWYWLLLLIPFAIYFNYRFKL